MRTSRSYAPWNHPGYEVKVRATMYLWGSAGITKDMSFDKPLVLHIHNDLFGEVITFGTQNAGGLQQPMGTLKPGECVSIPLNNISGIFASCAQESTVCCLIQ